MSFLFCTWHHQIWTKCSGVKWRSESWQCFDRLVGGCLSHALLSTSCLGLRGSLIIAAVSTLWKGKRFCMDMDGRCIELWVGLAKGPDNEYDIPTRIYRHIPWDMLFTQCQCFTRFLTSVWVNTAYMDMQIHAMYVQHGSIMFSWRSQETRGSILTFF